jgi:hypothetical protein
MVVTVRDSGSPETYGSRLSDDGSVERPASQNQVDRRGAPNLPEDVLGQSATDQEDTFRSSR